MFELFEACERPKEGCTVLTIRTGPNFIMKDLPSVLILIIAEIQMIHCFNKYN